MAKRPIKLKEMIRRHNVKIIGDLLRAMDELGEYIELVTIYVANDGLAAHALRLALEAEGISAQVVGEQLSSAVGELPATLIQVPVQVSPDDASRARELAVQFFAQVEMSPK